MNPLTKRIGIIGGGQLGKMMILAAKEMNFYVTILDPAENCPAHSIADKQIVAHFYDTEAIKALADCSDVITYESEHIDANTLIELENNGHIVYPTAASLRNIQDKFVQKSILKKNGILVPCLHDIASSEDLKEFAKQYGYPLVLKTKKEGYDGKGIFIIKNDDMADTIETREVFAEQFIKFEKEISVLACRSANGQIVAYPVAENLHKDSILDETRVPAQISEKTSLLAMETAKRVMEVFEGVGMFCVEMFVTTDGKIYVNEVAPRPHNSGHYTIECCTCSQFEQHIRAISGLPLGDTRLITPGVMRNLIGDGSGDRYIISGSENALSINGVHLHIYGKDGLRPKRKMGHITVTSLTVEDAADKAKNAHGHIKFEGEGKR